ncbi:MAG: hypothetical protein QNJ62_05170 [Methyloceanibacter sp.]|nr:hypothetical protein [Methyloceanibacter sp.]
MHLVPLRFEAKYRQSKEGYEDWVTAFIDQNTQPNMPWTFWRESVERQLRNDGTSEAERLEVLGAYDRHYAAWKKTESDEIMVDGMPLKEWPPLNREQVQALKTAHILSVEQLAQTSDTQLEKVGPGFKGLKALAQKYLEEKKDSDLIARLDSMERNFEASSKAKDDEIAALKAQLAAQTVAAQTAAATPAAEPEPVAEPTAAEPTEAPRIKRGPGRPKKAA